MDADSTVREFSLFSEFIFPTTLSPTHSSPNLKPSSFFIRIFLYRASVYNAFVSIYVHASSCIVYRREENEKKTLPDSISESGNKKLAERRFLLFPTVS